jgi:aminodeoxyfutalosine deaminase
LYARCEEIARRENVPLTTHLAESQGEMEMFRDAGGPAYRFLSDIGRPMDDCGHDTPLSLFLRTRSVDERWIVAHLNELDPGDFDLLARTPRFHVAHCPRSHAFFDHAPFALERLRALGFNVALGTDSLASNSSLSLFAEMRELSRKEPQLSPREIVEMATVNGARAIGQSNRLGCIVKGAAADLIALPIKTGVDVFQDIVAFDDAVSWMMVNGEMVN